jgi:hypothetical protein
MEHDLEKARNLKLILSAFQQLLGFFFIKGNYFASLRLKMSYPYVELFGCGKGQFPISYLGIPIHYQKHTNAERKYVEKMIQKRLSTWKGKFLSLGGRFVFIN